MLWSWCCPAWVLEQPVESTDLVFSPIVMTGNQTGEVCRFFYMSLFCFAELYWNLNVCSFCFCYFYYEWQTSEAKLCLLARQTLFCAHQAEIKFFWRFKMWNMLLRTFLFFWCISLKLVPCFLQCAFVSVVVYCCLIPLALTLQWLQT